MSKNTVIRPENKTPPRKAALDEAKVGSYNLDALNVGMMMNRQPEEEVQKAILEFATHYGLLG